MKWIPLLCLILSALVLLAAACSETVPATPSDDRLSRLQSILTKNWWITAAVTPLAALLVWSCLSQHRQENSEGPLGATRITLLAVDIPLGSGAQATIGGDPTQDDLVFGRPISGAASVGLTPGAVVLSRQESLNIAIKQMASAIVTVGHDVVGARPMPSGWSICALPCAVNSPTVHLSSGAVYGPSRFALRAPSGAVVPLDTDATVFARPPACGSDSSRHDITLFIRDGKAPASHALANAAEQICVYATPSAAEKSTFVLPPSTLGSSWICSFTHLVTCQAVPLQNGRLVDLPVDQGFWSPLICGLFRNCIRAPAAAQLSRLTHFQLTDRDGVVRVEFPFPVERLFTPEAEDQISQGIRLATAAAEDERLGAEEKPALFEQLGPRFDAVNHVVIDPPREPKTGFSVRAAPSTVSGSGSDVVIGTTSKAEFDVRTLDFDHGVFGQMRLLAALALGASLACTWALRRSDRLAAIVLGAVDLLLALRLVIAVEGAFMDGAPSVQTFPLNAVPELTLGPLILLLIWPQAPRRWTGCMLLFACTVLLTMITGAFRQQSFLIGSVILLVAGAIPHVAGWLARVIRSLRFSAITACTSWVMVAHPMMVLCWGSIIMFLARVGLGMAGHKEAFSVGSTRIPMSLLFVPAIIFTFTPLIADLRRGGITRAQPRWAIFATAFGLSVGVLFASAVVKDFGFGIYAWPVAMALTAAFLARDLDRANIRDFAMSATLALVLVLLIYALVVKLDARLILGITGIAIIAMGIAFFVRAQSLWLVPALLVIMVSGLIASVGALEPFGPSTFGLHEAVHTDVNRDRLLAALAPGDIDEVGTAAAGDYANTLSAMRVYSQPLTGRGFLSAPEPAVLKRYQLTDNAPAIHIMSPFGRLGAVALLLAVGAVSIAAVTRAIRAERPVAPWLGALAAMTLWLVDSYMFLANNGTAFFTGRNVYLLSPLSISDLLEGLLLFALVGISLGMPTRAAAV